MYYVSRYRGAPSYCQDTEGIIEQRILTEYTYRKYKTVLKSSLRYIMFLGVNGGRREAEAEPAVVKVPENGWEDFLFLVELSE